MTKEKIKNIVIPAQEKEKKGREAVSQIHAMKYNKLCRVGNFIWVKPRGAEKWTPGKIVGLYEYFFLIETKNYPVSVSWIDLYLGDITITQMSLSEIIRTQGSFYNSKKKGV